MIEQGTTERLFQKYNTFTQRVTIENISSRKSMFNAFQRTLSQFLPVEKSAKILDVACGEGALLSFLKLKKYDNIFGFDISSENIDICHSLGLNFVQKFDALKINDFESQESFDVIFALDILEHIPKEKAVIFLEQIKNRLKPGGYVIIQTPNMGCVTACLLRYNDLSHEFGLTEKSCISLFTIAGFDINNISIKPAWNASTLSGYLREAYLCLLHHLIFITDGAGYSKIPTKNLLIRACREK
jgi:2-polyprenyl-3-methyl-5-hydroxy-6-metoxy-1,4-benzoquinol methylase